VFFNYLKCLGINCKIYGRWDGPCYFISREFAQFKVVFSGVSQCETWKLEFYCIDFCAPFAVCE
jgi:hypothetical protein